MAGELITDCPTIQMDGLPLNCSAHQLPDGAIGIYHLRTKMHVAIRDPEWRDLALATLAVAVKTKAFPYPTSKNYGLPTSLLEALDAWNVYPVPW